MATASEKNFEDYKRTEAKALELMKEMKSVSAKQADIELEGLHLESTNF